MLDPGEPGERIFVPDYIEVKELAGLLELKPYKVVADVLALGFRSHDSSRGCDFIIDPAHQDARPAIAARGYHAD